MNPSTTGLILAPAAAIDLQTHTIYSDGTWTPEQLIDYLVSEQFSLAAITDHDRVDTTSVLQQLAAEKHMPLLVAAEMTTRWQGRGGVTDILCYGFDPAAASPLNDLGLDILRRQQENSREVYENLCRSGHLEESPGELDAILNKPTAQQPQELFGLLVAKNMGEAAAEKRMRESGYRLQTNDTAAAVDAAHRSGAVCLIAHPGRTDGFIIFDVDLLDQFRQEIPIDGLEVYYPRHTPQQVAMYCDYAQKHGLLTSSGSDSHGPSKKPIKYQAELSRNLLERLGIQVR